MDENIAAFQIQVNQLVANVKQAKTTVGAKLGRLTGRHSVIVNGSEYPAIFATDVPNLAGYSVWCQNTAGGAIVVFGG